MGKKRWPTKSVQDLFNFIDVHVLFRGNAWWTTHSLASLLMPVSSCLVVAVGVFNSPALLLRPFYSRSLLEHTLSVCRWNTARVIRRHFDCVYREYSRNSCWKSSVGGRRCSVKTFCRQCQRRARFFLTFSVVLILMTQSPLTVFTLYICRALCYSFSVLHSYAVSNAWTDRASFEATLGLSCVMLLGVGVSTE